MEQQGLPRDALGFKRLTAAYISRLAHIVGGHGRTAIAWQEAMDHYGPTAANPTPPSADLPPSTVIEQWLEPPWNWANLSSITGVGYLGRPDATWPSGYGGFSSLVTLGWYLDSTATLNAWEQVRTRAPPLPPLETAAGLPTSPTLFPRPCVPPEPRAELPRTLCPKWTQVYAREPLTNKSCTYDASGYELGCECKCPSGPWRDGTCHCYDLRNASAGQKAKVLGGEAPLWG